MTPLVLLALGLFVAVRVARAWCSARRARDRALAAAALGVAAGTAPGRTRAAAGTPSPHVVPGPVTPGPVVPLPPARPTHAARPAAGPGGIPRQRTRVAAHAQHAPHGAGQGAGHATGRHAGRRRTSA